MATVVALPVAMVADLGPGRFRSDAVGGDEEHLLEQARQITTPGLVVVTGQVHLVPQQAT